MRDRIHQSIVLIYRPGDVTAQESTKICRCCLLCVVAAISEVNLHHLQPQLANTVIGELTLAA